MKRLNLAWLAALVAVLAAPALSSAAVPLTRARLFTVMPEAGTVEVGYAPRVKVQVGDDVDGEVGQEREHKNDWGGWGGFSLGWFFPDLDGFQGMTDERGLDGFQTPLRTWQGRGFVSINNFRIGGIGGGGLYYESESINGDHRWASLDIIYGGFTMDYLVPITEQFGIFGGVVIGGGMAWMAADGDDIDDHWSQFETFDYTAPEVGVSIKVTNWFRVEATAQYNYIGIDTNGSSFYAANGEKMVDLSSMSGPSYNIWFLFGYGG